jgi:hypothetical protein
MTITKNEKSLLTITNQLEQLKAIGTLPSEIGSDEHTNLPMHEKLRKATWSSVPRAFKKDVNESLMLLTYDLRHKERTDAISNAASIYLDDVLHKIKTWYKVMQPASTKTVGMVLETIASTFSCNVPNELGLSVYIKILSRFPEFVLTYNTEKIIASAKWRRLPLPKEFLDVMEPDFECHKLWLQNFHQTYLSFAQWRQKRYNTTI